MTGRTVGIVILTGISLLVLGYATFKLVFQGDDDALAAVGIGVVGLATALVLSRTGQPPRE